MVYRILRLFLYLTLFLHLTPVLAHGGAHLGKITFLASGNKAAQPFFERGVMWLHSFEYKEARAEFQAAAKTDPDFIMAYWGEAMTYNHSLWNEQDLLSARKVLTKIAASPQARIDKAKTTREKGFIHAINLLYGLGSKKERDAAYADAMRDLYRANPNDDEIASFYALALIGVAGTERDFRNYMQAAGIVEEIYGRNPCHPGALHYAIHSYDDPIHAPLGLRAARTYAKMAPDASHALHMPSHIFLALGMWDDVISSNKAAWEAGAKQNHIQDSKAYTIDDIHALHWLSYGYLQKQQYDQAYAAVKQMEIIAANANSPMSKWYYALMRAAYLMESHNWTADLKSLDMEGVELSAHTSNLYIDAISILNNKLDTNRFEKIDVVIQKLVKLISSQQNNKDTYEDYFTSVTASGITTAKITLLELKAQLSWEKGESAKAIQFLKQATKLDDQLSFGYGPPIPIKPSHELLAEYLMKLNKLKEAHHEFTITKYRMPNRYLAGLGLMQTSTRLQANGILTPKIQKPYFNKLMLPEFYK